MRSTIHKDLFHFIFLLVCLVVTTKLRAESFECSGKIVQHQYAAASDGAAPKVFFYDEILKLSVDDHTVQISNTTNLRATKYVSENGEVHDGYKYRICTKSNREITFNNFFCNPSLVSKIKGFEYVVVKFNRLNKKLNINSENRYPGMGMNFVQEGEFKCQ